LDTLISPLVLYGACALGAAGVALALPKQRASPFVFGAILAAAGFGLVMVLLGRASIRALAGGAEGAPEQDVTAQLVWDALPNYHFYIFSLIALGSALRVITHQRPIYSALWFIVTIISSCGLYLILQAEFMAFALVIVYGGAILITYMFVIMLATEAPTEEAVEAMSVYDRVAREPVVATFAGFLILAVLSTMLAGGSQRIRLDPANVATDQPLALMPQRVERVLREAGAMKEGEKLALITSRLSAKGEHVDLRLRAGDDGKPVGELRIIASDGKTTRVMPVEQWPKDLKLSNTERVAFELIDENPAAIEIAAVVLLMAMLGAIVLARKKVEMDEIAKAQAAARAREGGELSGGLGAAAPFVPPAVGGNT
jgi:NADH-quinone oxidoreductase subunit J